MYVLGNSFLSDCMQHNMIDAEILLGGFKRSPIRQASISRHPGIAIDVQSWLERTPLDTNAQRFSIHMAQKT